MIASFTDSNLATEPVSNLATEPVSNLSTEPVSSLATEPVSSLATEPVYRWLLLGRSAALKLVEPPLGGSLLFFRLLFRSEYP